MTYSGLLLLAAALALQGAGQVPTGLDFNEYRALVEPIFLKARDAFGPGGTCFVCHTKVTSQLRLQPLAPGASAWTEEQSWRNFEHVRRLVVPGDPLRSRLLLHPLAVAAGGDPLHLGGKHWQSQDDPEWQMLAAWVRRAPSAGAAAATAAPTLDFALFKSRVQPVFLRKRAGLARCVACHAQRTSFLLQPIAARAASWDEEAARLNFEAVQRVVVAGDPQSSRLLMVPLAADAGGDPFHPGGKHWMSQNDPEWQALAAWVRGEVPGGRSNR